MELENPFSLYDFLGYMLPGMFLILGIDVITDFPSFHLFTSEVISKNYFMIIIFIFVCYLTGHIGPFALNHIKT